MSFEWELAGQPVPGAREPTLQWRPTRATPSVSIGAVARNAAGTASPGAGAVSVVPAGVRYLWSTFAGKPGVAGHLDGQGSNARFSYPSGIAMNDQGMIYVADADSNRVRKITPEGEVSTFSDAWGNPMMFRTPVDIASGADGTVLVLNQGSSIVRWFGESLVARFPGGDWGLGVAPDQTVWRAVNTYVERIALDGSVNRMASNLQTVVDVTFDAAGNAYLAEAGGPTIRRLGLDGQLTVYAGTPGQFGQADGPASVATFQHPNSVSFDGLGNLYVADEFASTIRRISPDGVVTTLGGYNNRSGFADGIGFAARFVFPRRVLATQDGILYVTDTGAHTIRKGVPVPETAVPRLRAEHAEGGVALSWTVGDGLVWLERSAAAEAGTTEWQAADPLSDSGTTRHLVRPEGRAFYRLRSP
jgi:DNA-binding beta-propeller fold protein YncE